MGLLAVARQRLEGLLTPISSEVALQSSPKQQLAQKLPVYDSLPAPPMGDSHQEEVAPIAAIVWTIGLVVWAIIFSATASALIATGIWTALVVAVAFKIHHHIRKNLPADDGIRLRVLSTTARNVQGTELLCVGAHDYARTAYLQRSFTLEQREAAAEYALQLRDAIDEWKRHYDLTEFERMDERVQLQAAVDDINDRVLTM